jgi:hypothetical protein
MLGRGRKSIRPAIGQVRELTKGELESPRAKATPIQKFRDSHHRMARLFASGLRVGQVAELTGYSVSRVSLFHSSPAFQDLIAEKRKVEDEIARDQITAMNAMILSNGLKAERKLADKLDDDDDSEEMSVRELISIARDAADRVGLSKRSIQTNVNMDFAQLLDRAIKRSEEVLRSPSESQLSLLPRSGELKLVETSSSSVPLKAPGRGLLRRL